jgi:hypothetical protein
VGQFERSFPQGLKPEVILLHLTYGLKPVPFRVSHRGKLSPLVRKEDLVKFLSAFVAVVLATGALRTDGQELTLVNPLNFDRTQEVIEFPLQPVLDSLHATPAQASSIVAEDAATHERIPDQLYSGTVDAPPDKLLLLVQLRARANQRIAFRLAPNAAPLKAQVFGREAAERKDDFAWENELVAYRIYGPALEATGEITSGIDVWSKRIPNFVIDSFYKRDAEGARTHDPSLSYHIDNGQGLDSYYVGPTRGCGGTAVFAGGKLIVSKNYTKLHMLGDGPIRFSFEVTYAPWNASGVMVTETKRVTLDAGTHMNKIESTYTFEGNSTLDLAAGIAVHEGASAEFPVQGSIASVWDTPQIPSAGRITTGLVADQGQHAKTIDAAGHALMVFTRHSGETFTYFAGSGWSKADMPTAQAWNEYLKLQLEQVEHPIAMRWSKR